MYKNKQAILIGNWEYSTSAEFRELDGNEIKKEMGLMKKMLMEHKWNILPVAIKENLTDISTSIKMVLKDLIGELKGEDLDQLLVYFSGNTFPFYILK